MLEDFQKLRNTEDSSKEKEKEKVKTMAAEIMVLELKNKKDFGVPNIKELEQVSLILVHLSPFISHLTKQRLSLSPFTNCTCMYTCTCIFVPPTVIQWNLSIVDTIGACQSVS